jgi:AcrR family transcriptional regulator
VKRQRSQMQAKQAPPTGRRSRITELDDPDVDRRQLIIRAATTCFAKYGYTTTTNKMVAEVAGVAPGLIYYYFESKQTLFAAVYSEITRYRYERSRQAVASQDTLVSQISALIEDLIQMWEVDTSYVEFHGRTMHEVHHDSSLYGALVEGRQEREGIWQSIVEAAKRRHELPETTSTASIVDMFILWFTGLLTLLPSLGADRSREAGRVFLTALPGLCASADTNN